MDGPHFIGTKLAAYRGRGNDDPIASHDLEDIVGVVDGRPELVEECVDSPAELRAYLSNEVGQLLGMQAFSEALPGHVLDTGRLPIVRGLAVNRDDLLRRSVIMALMCQGHLEFEAINLAWLIDFQTLFSKELAQLESMQSQGLVQLSDTGIQVTPMGWFFVRGVAMVFDRYLQADRNHTRFSKII